VDAATAVGRADPATALGQADDLAERLADAIESALLESGIDLT
jgi:hypothetical protein